MLTEYRFVYSVKKKALLSDAWLVAVERVIISDVQGNPDLSFLTTACFIARTMHQKWSSS